MSLEEVNPCASLLLIDESAGTGRQPAMSHDFFQYRELLTSAVGHAVEYLESSWSLIGTLGVSFF